MTQVQHELIALLDCLIADADDHQHLLIALGHTDDHIVQQCAGQTVQRTHLRFIVGAGDVDVTTLDLDVHHGTEVLCQGSQGALDCDNIAFRDRNRDTGRDRNRHSTNS